MKIWILPVPNSYIKNILKKLCWPVDIIYRVWLEINEEEEDLGSPREMGGKVREMGD
jgi:hypothetical protein